jgi:hypothetical protein
VRGGEKENSHHGKTGKFFVAVVFDQGDSWALVSDCGCVCQ